MAYLNDLVLDNGLSTLKSSATHIYICTAEPATFAAATSTNACGNKSFGAGAVFPNAIAAGSPSGRKVTTAPVTDGSVTATATASHWAITQTTGSVLWAASSLASSQAVTNANTFTLGAFDVRLPGTGG